MVFKRCIALILSMLLLLLALSGCGKNGFAGMTMVGISMSGKEEENNDGQQLKEALEAAGYAVEIAFAEGSSEQQASELAALVDDGASVVIVEPVDAAAAAEAVGKLDVADVAIVGYGQPIAGQPRYLGANYQEMGRQQARHVLEALEVDEKGDAAAIELMTGADAASALAFEGAMEVLKPYVDKGSVVIVSGKNTAEACRAEDAAAYVDDLVAKHYTDRELNGLLCLGTDQSLPVIETLMEKYPGNVFPTITAMGYDEEAAEKIDQYLLSAVSYAPERPLVDRAVDLIMTVVGGAAAENEKWLVNPVLLERDNLKDYLVNGEIVVPETDGDAVEAVG